MEYDIAVIGAGMAGLTAAAYLHRAGKRVALIEANERVGGRVGTDQSQGFLLDRGFQVYFTAYPEGKALLNYATLGFHSFQRGVYIRSEGAFSKIVDPRDDLLGFFKAFGSKLLSWGDFLNFLKLAYRLRQGEYETYIYPGMEAGEALKRYETSDRFFDKFVRPFFGGILLDRTLHSPATLVPLTLQMLMQGQTVLPTGGMQAIPEQLASKLPADSLFLNRRVIGLEPGGIHLEGGERIRTPIRLIAGDLHAAARLLNKPDPQPGRTVQCYYFSAPVSPTDERMLVLNGDPKGMINHLAVLSDVNPSYSPPGANLISVTVLGAEEDPSAVVRELKGWYGDQVKQWDLIKNYTVTNAHPHDYPAFLVNERQGYRIANGLYYCGDYLEAPSINLAMMTGRKAAEQILREDEKALRMGA